MTVTLRRDAGAAAWPAVAPADGTCSKGGHRNESQCEQYGDCDSGGCGACVANGGENVFEDMCVHRGKPWWGHHRRSSDLTAALGAGACTAGTARTAR